MRSFAIAIKDVSIENHSRFVSSCFHVNGLFLVKLSWTDNRTLHFKEDKTRRSNDSNRRQRE